MNNNIQLIKSIEHRPPVDGIDHINTVQYDGAVYKILNPHWINSIKSRGEAGVEALKNWCLKNITDEDGYIYDHVQVDRESWTIEIVRF